MARASSGAGISVARSSRLGLRKEGAVCGCSDLELAQVAVRGHHRARVVYLRRDDPVLESEIERRFLSFWRTRYSRSLRLISSTAAAISAARSLLSKKAFR